GLLGMVGSLLGGLGL
uniref:Caeridin-5 n=1 Tax=Ranoidea caerulea TaxID=30344 RepID=CDN5_RANCA|nr:RecName: Full=Caeridin-5 [Ranoidea caerulea]prf//1911335E caeridin 5 [Ranoidea caerulea]